MNYYPDTSPQFKQLVESINGKKIAVVGHVRPDGDCIGSQVALCRVLQSRGIEAVCVNHDPVPATLKFLVENTAFHRGTEFDLDGWDIMSVDCADARRTGPSVAPHMERTLGNIDHHISNTQYGKMNLIEGTSSATGEILAGFFFDCDYEVDTDTANGLYVGIATDTGQFRFPSTTRHTFEISGKLIDRGVDLAKVNLELYEQESFAKLELLQRFLESLELHFDGRVCVGLLKDGVYDEVGASTEDSEGLVDYARSIEGVDIGVLVEERSGKIKGSLRAKEQKYRCDLIAKQFNGGGHAAAAGLNDESSMEEFLPRLLAAISTQLEAIDSES
ncbi:DHH family phosphoesterase [Opitutia bacterium ISCC 51]|nr:DHH family phosphoesterase [Opitutae bacterium ISCC 51]QXD30029.1 DHH family phosphoesterase [Opitutae bacterium ISCC 52]